MSSCAAATEAIYEVLTVKSRQNRTIGGLRRWVRRIAAIMSSCTTLSHSAGSPGSNHLLLLSFSCGRHRPTLAAQLTAFAKAAGLSPKHPECSCQRARCHAVKPMCSIWHVTSSLQSASDAFNTSAVRTLDNVFLLPCREAGRIDEHVHAAMVLQNCIAARQASCS